MPNTRYFGSYPLHAVVGSVPESYTANDRFAVAHGMQNFVGQTGRRVPTVYDVTEIVPDQYETQTLTISGTPTDGTYTLTYGDEETDALDHDADAAAIEAALEALDTIGTGNVAVSGSGPFTIDLSELDFPELIVGDGALLTGGTDEAATVTVTHTYTHNQIGVVGVDEENIYLRCSATSGDFLIKVG